MKQLAAVAFLGFVGLWIVGLFRDAPRPVPSSDGGFSSVRNDDKIVSRQQLANNLNQLGMGKMPLPVLLDQADIDGIQVFEKTARLSCATTSFDSDQASIRFRVKTHQAVVFNETNGGIAPSRRFVLEIGVHPDKFDALVAELRGVARLESVSVQQQDRTGEFRRLHAQRQSLKKHLEAVQKLRGAQNPTIDDQLKLEQKVQDIEKELQSLGVQLGDFVGKDSYYHVFVTLSEADGRVENAFSLPWRVGSAFLWALSWWLGAMLVLSVLVGTVMSIRALVAKPTPATVGPVTA